MYQRPFQKIQSQTTAHLAQTMTLLYMNNDELNQEINRAINENPALVISEDLRCPKCKSNLHSGQKCPICTAEAEKSGEDSVIFVTHRDDYYSPVATRSDEDFYPDEILGQHEASLGEFILAQIAADLLEDERMVAAYILNQLDEDGFFTENLFEVASYYHVPLEKVEKVRRMIQHAEPLGSGSPSPEEAIRVQLEIFNEADALPEYFLLIADRHLQNLLRKNFKHISRDLGITIEKVENAADFFSKNLNPFPARAHWGTFREPAVKEHLTYSNPDVIINHLNDDPTQPLLVEIVLPGNSILEVNPYYSDALKDASEDIKTNLKNDLSKAHLFIKCLQQRNNTIQKMVGSLVSIQKEFILKGEKYLQPVTRVQLSKELNVHESTISRAVANKTVQLPDGRMIPMASFFDRSLSLRTILKELIQSENKREPLSDSALVEILAEKGHEVARRTVAKYRMMEGILPAHQRRTNTQQEPL